MIINLWSTPRVGSVWYSMHLAKTYDCTRITEMFNPHHLNIYRLINSGGSITNCHSYKDGSRYDEYYLDDNGVLDTTPMFQERSRTVEEEHEYRKQLLYNMSPDSRVVFHNHVDPIDPDVLKYLTSIADKNIYIYRKDKLAQLASYAIAFISKRFAQHTRTQLQYESIDELPVDVIKQLLKRIAVWESIEKNGEVIAYEDINFYEESGMLYKQVKDYTKILSPNAINQLSQLLSESSVQHYH